jgi:hypothetical protein
MLSGRRRTQASLVITGGAIEAAFWIAARTTSGRRRGAGPNSGGLTIRELRFVAAARHNVQTTPIDERLVALLSARRE